MLITRQIEPKLIAKLIPNKAVLLFGARRVGKTVLLKQILQKYTGKSLLINGEDYDAQLLLERKSISNYKQLLSGINLLVIDEAQHIPDIGQKIKLIVDEIPGISVLASGSSSFDLLNRTGEPLVGRSSVFHLFPFSQIELSQQENAFVTLGNLESRLIYGAYPELIGIENIEHKKDYLRDIVNAYLLKDILSIDGIKNSAKMKDLLRLAAFQTGSEISVDELGKKLGLSRNTVEKYLDMLSKVFIVFRLGGYSKNLRKEITRSGKWYFFDNGIRNAILGSYQPVNNRNDIGMLWENYLISERVKQNYFSGEHRSYYFWRTYDGQEIDLIEESDTGISAFEIKWGDKQARAPKAFAQSYTQASYQVINQDNYLNFIS